MGNRDAKSGGVWEHETSEANKAERINKDERATTLKCFRCRVGRRSSRAESACTDWLPTDHRTVRLLAPYLISTTNYWRERHARWRFGGSRVALPCRAPAAPASQLVHGARTTMTPAAMQPALCFHMAKRRKGPGVCCVALLRPPECNLEADG